MEFINEITLTHTIVLFMGLCIGVAIGLIL